MKLPNTPFLLALCALGAPSAQASDAPAQATRLSKVEVEAMPPEEAKAALDAWGRATLQRTPAAIAVIERSQIDDRHIRTLSELAREDAALGDNYAPVGYYQNLIVRGFPLDLGTGYRLNGLTIAGEQMLALEDKAQVQVLRGPAALEAGAMEPGGAVHFVSKRPEEVRSITLGTDSHGSRLAALDAGTWLTPELGVRANLGWEDMHSYVEHADGRRNFYALALDWRLGDRTMLQADSSYHASAQRSVSGYQLLGGSVLPDNASASVMLGYQPWQEPVRMHTSNSSLRLIHEFSDAWQLQLAGGHSRSVIDDSVAFAYGCFYVPACWTGEVPGNAFSPDGDYDIYDYRNPDDTRVSDELRASLDGSFRTGRLRHELSLGVSTFRREIERYLHVNDYVGTGNINDPQVPVFAPSPKEIGPRVRRLASWQRSVFALDRVHLGERWQLIAGGRRVQLDERSWSKRGALERDDRFSRTLPQLAAMWTPTQTTMLYASYSEGISLGREAPFWTSNEGEMLGPRLARQVEAGVKLDAGQDLALGAALFRIRQPWQHAAPDATSAGFTFVERGTETHSGLELSANAALSDDLRLLASTSLIRARGEDSGTPAYEGHQIANVPRLRASLHLDYRLPSLPALTLMAGARHASRNPATMDGSVHAPAWTVLDAGLSYRAHWGERDMVWRLSVDNLTNRFYWRDVGSSEGDSYLFPGAPRLARLTVSFDL